MKNTVTLKYDSWIAIIDLSHGANCISLRNTSLGLNILRERDAESLPDNPYLYGMPLLFPQNRISGGKFIFEGREYSFPINEPSTGCHIHGELHSTPFEPKEVGDNFLRCVYEAKKGEYLSFPHAFRIEIYYRLSSEGLSQRVLITNNSAENMPCLLAFHTTFNIPFAEGSLGEDVFVLAELKEEIERNMSLYLPTGQILPPDEVFNLLNIGEFIPTQHSVSRHYKTVPCGKIKLTDRQKGVSVVYDNDEKYLFRLIYNAASPSLLCIEPESSAVDAPNSRLGREYSNFTYIKPGRTEEYISRIYLERKQ